ncbi:GFA family protein [Paracoccus tegillarcae]|uniref:Aldehyde-activating protein n=1 Tax=Paracoccus tegillarcae TaxID=1529068 RepID=A0A2K9ETE3_9RHOB|nr:GFA family protein [Paracoccus tegillarcae]AUH35035.1 aldehyde-activating protein [Paracoccus tegillarcae]
MTAATPVTGRCLCGACRYTASATALTTSVCHCETCRRWAGGALFSVDLGRTVVMNDDAPLLAYASSPGMQRISCAVCAAPLYRDSLGGGHQYGVLEALDQNEDFLFNLEIFVEEKPSNYEFSNDTVKMTGAQVLAEMSANGKAG